MTHPKTPVDVDDVREPGPDSAPDAGDGPDTTAGTADPADENDGAESQSPAAAGPDTAGSEPDGAGSDTAGTAGRADTAKTANTSETERAGGDTSAVRSAAGEPGDEELEAAGVKPPGEPGEDGPSDAGPSDDGPCSRPAAPREALGPMGGSADRVALRSPAELADALPYLLGYHPDDSVVLVGVHGDSGRFGCRIRLGIPTVTSEWPEAAEQLAGCLLAAGAARGQRPDAVLVYVCQEPLGAEDGRGAMERLRPLALSLVSACAARGMPVREALCVSAGRFWSYGCRDGDCCPPDGGALAPPGTSVLAAASAYAGIRLGASLAELTARLGPLGAGRSRRQERALDRASAELLPALLTAAGRPVARERVLGLAGRLCRRYRAAPALTGAAEGSAGAAFRLQDARDDAILSDEEAAVLILGLQDRATRDRAAEWMEGPEAEPALRLWRALSRRCVGAYREHAVAPITLAGWVAWSCGDEPAARVAFGQALALDPRYRFALLLHAACSRGADPEMLRKCLRRQRGERG
ncbi:DUF4192 family protein [Streptomyces alkaliterrae]|nr:DUF4192 family protein [Streptomyces alkaliterrae]